VSARDASHIPFNKPFMIGPELDYIRAAVERGHLAGDGPFTQQCREWLERSFTIPRALLTPSGTAALELAALLCPLEPGDEVILPSYTFSSTANAFVLRGAKPVFVDIREDTLNLDERLIEERIGPRTRVVVPVHYAGVACDMDRIGAIAERHGLVVVEDAAQGVNATYRGRFLGTLGRLGAYSFHETKNVLAGEGGALALRDAADIERAEILREKGTNRAKFFRGEVDKYTWVDVGSSLLPSEIVAAYLCAQLEHCDEITAQRLRTWEHYAQALAPLAQQGRMRLPCVPAECRHNGHMFYVILADAAQRDPFLAHLKQRGVQAVFHYVPLHTSPMGQRFGGRAGQLPVTEDLSERLVRLPCYYGLTRPEQDRVIETMFEYFRTGAR